MSYAETYSIVFNDESLPLQNVNPKELCEAINLKYALKYSLDNLDKFDKNLIISIGDLIGIIKDYNLDLVVIISVSPFKTLLIYPLLIPNVEPPITPSSPIKLCN